MGLYERMQSQARAGARRSGRSLVGGRVVTEVDVQVLGVSDLLKSLRGFEDKLARSMLRAAIRPAAKMVMAHVKEIVPVKTGALRAGIRLVPIKGRKIQGINIGTPTRTQLGISPTSPSYYPAHVEFGHKGAPPHSYMRRGMDEKRESAKKMISDGLARLIDLIAASGAKTLTGARRFARAARNYV